MAYKSGNPALTILVILVGVGLLAAAIGGLFSKFGPRLDRVPDRERAERQRLFDEVKVFALPLIKTSEFEIAFEHMNLTAQEREELRTELAQPLAADSIAQRRRLFWLTLWDTDAEDGDVVSLQSGSYKAPYKLKNKPNEFPVLLAPDGILHIVGLRDGDGRGITAGALAGRTAIALPVLAPDQRVWVSVTVR